MTERNVKTELEAEVQYVIKSVSQDMEKCNESLEKNGYRYFCKWALESAIQAETRLEVWKAVEAMLTQAKDLVEFERLLTIAIANMTETVMNGELMNSTSMGSNLATLREMMTRREMVSSACSVYSLPTLLRRVRSKLA